MKKGLLLSLAALALAGGVTLSACGGGSTSTSSPTSSDSTSSETSSSTATPTIDTSITFTGSSSVEVGATTTIRALYSASAGNSLVNFSVDDATVLQLPSVTENVASISVTGLKVGTAVITATSVEDPLKYNTFTIEVVAARDSLQTALSKIAQYTNYTVTSRPEDDSLVTDDNTIVLKRVEKGFTLTTAGGESIWMQASSTALNTGYAGIFGIGLDANGYGAYLLKDIESASESEGYTYGSYNTTPERIQGDNGFLTADDFAGAGASATAPSDTTFTTLANINYAWAPSGKSTNNTYTIEGDDEDYYAAYLECVIWSICDPTGMIGVMRANNNYYYTDAASYITTTATVNADGTVDFKITPKEGTTYMASSDSSAVSYENPCIATISNVGTTTLDDDTTALLANESFVATVPELVDDLKYARAAMLGGDYVREVDYLGDGSAIYNVYFTEDYVLYDVTEDYVATVNAAGYSLNRTTPWGYYAGSDGYLHAFTMDYDYNITSDSAMTSYPNTFTSSGVEYDMLHYQLGYYEYSNMENYQSGIGWYSLSTTARSIWTNSSTTYYFSQSTLTGMIFAADGYDEGLVDWNDDGSSLAGTVNNGRYDLNGFISGINVVRATGATTPTSVTFMLGVGVASDGEALGYYVLSTTFSGFGTATTNDGNTTLSTLVRSATATDGE